MRGHTRNQSLLVDFQGDLEQFHMRLNTVIDDGATVVHGLFLVSGKRGGLDAIVTLA